jgi:hypothetical protein
MISSGSETRQERVTSCVCTSTSLVPRRKMWRASAVSSGGSLFGCVDTDQTSSARRVGRMSSGHLAPRGFRLPSLPTSTEGPPSSSLPAVCLF